MFFVAGPLVARLGARAVAYSAAAFAAATTLPGLAGSFPTLVLALAAAGATSGILDVAVNANAGRIERVTGRRLMPLAHGLYSVGILTGAVGGGHRARRRRRTRADPARRLGLPRADGRRRGGRPRPGRDARAHAACGSRVP